MTICKNCGHKFESKFCPDCGQKASTKRFSTRIVFSQLLDKLLPLNRGVLYTARQLLTRPGSMLRGYLAGKRVGFTKPSQFLLIVNAISLIFFSKRDFQRGMKDGMSVSNPDQNAQMLDFQQKAGDFLSANLSLLLVGMIPFLALTGRWFYKKHDVNYAEHFVMNCYLLAACTIIVMPFMTGIRLTGGNAYSPYAAAWFSVFYIAYYAWAHVGFFREPNRLWNVVKGVLTYLLAYLFYIVFVGLVAAVVAAVYFTMTKKG